MQVREPAHVRSRCFLLVFVPALIVAIAACQSGEREDRGPIPVIAPPAFRIEGKVLKPDSLDHSGILVFCAGTSYLAYTDELGRFAITKVPPGRYDIRAQHNDYRPAIVDQIVLDEATSDPASPIVLRDKKLERKETPTQQAERIFCSIMGHVVFNDGRPAEGVVVQIVGTDFRTATEKDGQFRLLRLDPGQWTLLFEKDGCRPQRTSINLKSGSLDFPKPIVLEMIAQVERRGIISGSVVLLDARGQQLNDYSAVLIYLEGQDAVRATLPDANGAFRFSDLAASRYQVSAISPGFISRDRAQADLTRVSEETVALTLQSVGAHAPEPGTLVGRVLKDDPADSLVGAMVGLIEIGATTLTDAKGAYTFANITPGTYTLIAQAEGYAPASLEEVAVQEGQQAGAPDLQLEKRREYPRVLFTSPANGQRDVTVRETVPLTVRFSKKMNPDSLRAAFSIEPKVECRLFAGREHQMSDYDRLYVELLGVGPVASLHFDAAYAVTISTAAADDENLRLEQPYQFTFRTGRATIIGTRPADGQTEVYLDQAMYRAAISFNAPLDPKTVTPDKVRIRPSPGNAPQLAIVPSAMSGWSEIHVAAVWQKGTPYTVTVGSGIRTADGSAISNLPYTFRFTTSAGRPVGGTSFQPFRSRR